MSVNIQTLFLLEINLYIIYHTTSRVFNELVISKLFFMIDFFKWQIELNGPIKSFYNMRRKTGGK